MSNKIQRMRFFILIIILLLLTGIFYYCTNIKNLVFQPDPRERYRREFAEGDTLFAAWEKAFERGMKDSLEIELPYQEKGVYTDDVQQIYSYNFELKAGEVLNLHLELDTTNTRLFIDLFIQAGDSLPTYEFLQRNVPATHHLKYTANQTGTYKIIVQPEIAASSAFVLSAYQLPVFSFPVAGVDNRAIQSFWGASRDGGRRKHEGIDIFAPRGTPVVAASRGSVRFTGERGLGGKQVWIRSAKPSYSLYYAHLDSIAATSMESVAPGDTIGFVGNTGNARTTRPHLHFGIYGRNGAIDPLPFVFIREAPELPTPSDAPIARYVIVNAARANLRNQSSTKGAILNQVQQGDTLSLYGISGQWLHVATPSKTRAFVHQSLVK
jgi:murein DD-endopeptidase MepM/ murein hydrolase activator NlpD